MWAHRTIVRTRTQATSYSLVFGGYIDLLLEIQFSSLKVPIHEEMTNEEKASLRLTELEALDVDKLAS